MGDYAAKGHDLVKKADKKLNSFGLFGAFNKYDDAAELLEKAANQFKLAKACEQLSLLYCKCGHQKASFCSLCACSVTSWLREVT